MLLFNVNMDSCHLRMSKTHKIGTMIYKESSDFLMAQDRDKGGMELSSVRREEEGTER